MRADTLKRVYFVINLLPETLLAGSDVELLERSRVTEAIAERNQVFMKDGLLEIIEADYRRIKTAEYYAYLVWIKYRWESKNFNLVQDHFVDFIAGNNSCELSNWSNCCQVYLDVVPADK